MFPSSPRFNRGRETRNTLAEHGSGRERNGRNPRGGGELVINTLSLPAASARLFFPFSLSLSSSFLLSLGLPRVHISGDAREGEGRREGPSKIKNKGRKAAAAAAYALMKFLTITLAATGEKVGIIGNGAKTMMNGRGIDERNINSNASPHCGCEEEEMEKKLFPPWNTSTKGTSASRSSRHAEFLFITSIIIPSF